MQHWRRFAEKYRLLRRFRACQPFIFLFCVLLSFSLTLGGTLAWFTASDRVTNNLEAPPEPGFYVTLVDVFDKTPGGNIFAKRVGAVNKDKKDALVRLLVQAVYELPGDSPGDPTTLMPVTVGGPGSGAMVILDDLNTADWILGADGWYYYTHILPPMTTTDSAVPSGSAGYTALNRNLFNTVSVNIPGVMADGERLKIEVKCEAVGTKPPNEYLTAWWGGTAPVSGDPLWSVEQVLSGLV